MKQLKFLIPLIALCLMLGTGRANAQWTVIDPSNIAQSIVNNSKSLVQESQTATHMVKNFQETKGGKMKCDCWVFDRLLV